LIVVFAVFLMNFSINLLLFNCLLHKCSHPTNQLPMILLPMIYFITSNPPAPEFFPLSFQTVL
jgi:hypothetical protein